MGYMHASWFLYPRHLHGVVAILSSYVGIKAVGLLSGSYLHARLILYVPAGIFQKQPETFRTAFHRTSASRWGLFGAILVIDLIGVLSQFLFGYLAPFAIDFSVLVQVLSEWSNIDEQFIAALLPSAIIYTLVVPVAGLWSAGLSITAYRKIVTIDDARAAVFD